MRSRFFIGFAAVLLLFSCNGKEQKTGASLSDFSVQLSLSSTSAKKTWAAGDQVRMFITEGDNVTFASLKAAGSGSTAQFTATGTVRTGGSYRFLYPESRSDLTLASHLFTSIPSQQTAVPGSADPAATILVGEVSDYKQTVSLVPASAYLKFKLTGEGAADIVRLTITALDGTYLAGDMRWDSTAGAASPQVVFTDARGRVEPSATISLTGDFQNGADYYVPVVPGEVKEGLKLEVIDANGRSQRFEISGAKKLAVGAVCDLQTQEVQSFGSVIMDEDESGDPIDTGDPDFVNIFSSTKGTSPYIIVYMGDGFTQSERTKFEDAANAALEFLFDVQPYRGLKGYFSAYICWTPAETSGFGTRWGTTYNTSSQMMASYGQEGRNKIYNYLAERIPEVKSGKTVLNNVGVFMLCNNSSYMRPVCDWENTGRFVTPVGLYGNNNASSSQWCFGGTWLNWEYRDGVKTTLSGSELQALGYASNGRLNGDYRNECLHEGGGHGIGRLGDEYWTNSTTSNFTGLDYYQKLAIPTMLNLAANATGGSWARLDNMREELIKKDSRYERLGTWEGGYGYCTGVWRAEHVSVMMDNRPYFSTWERALIYMRIMRVCEGKTSFDVRNQADLETFLDFDLSVNGIRDPLRDK